MTTQNRCPFGRRTLSSCFSAWFRFDMVKTLKISLKSSKYNFSKPISLVCVGNPQWFVQEHFFIFCIFDGFPNSTDWWNYWKNICDSEIFHQFFAGFYNSGTFFIFCVFDGFPNSTDWSNYWKNLCDSEIFHQFFAGFYNSDTFFIFCVFDDFPNSTDWWNHRKNLRDSEIFHQFFEGFSNSVTFFIFRFFDGFPNSTRSSNSSKKSEILKFSTKFGQDLNMVINKKSKKYFWSFSQ